MLTVLCPDFVCNSYWLVRVLLLIQNWVRENVWVGTVVRMMKVKLFFQLCIWKICPFSMFILLLPCCDFLMLTIKATCLQDYGPSVSMWLLLSSSPYSFMEPWVMSLWQYVVISLLRFEMGMIYASIAAMYSIRVLFIFSFFADLDTFTCPSHLHPQHSQGKAWKRFNGLWYRGEVTDIHHPFEASIHCQEMVYPLWYKFSSVVSLVYTSPAT